MSKQEEIREGIQDLIFEAQSWEDYTNEEMVDKILKYLHSQGVVIKVECPDCAWSRFGEESVGMTPCSRCDSTGYVIEPLIKGE